MATQRERGNSPEPTRDRILRHAVKRFSSQSYEGTGLREIASDAGVDVALVHRSFGSKEKLFAQCVRASIASDHVLANPGEGTMDSLFAEVLMPRAEGELRPIDIIVHSFSSPEAARVLREVGTEMVIAPLAKTCRHGSEVKIAITLSVLFGFTIMRDIIGIDSLKKACLEDLNQLLSKTKETLNADCSANPNPDDIAQQI